MRVQSKVGNPRRQETVEKGGKPGLNAKRGIVHHQSLSQAFSFGSLRRLGDSKQSELYINSTQGGSSFPAVHGAVSLPLFVVTLLPALLPSATLLPPLRYFSLTSP